VSEQRLNKPVLTVGRLASNDIHVPSQRVSRMHAKVYWDNKHNSWMIEDMDSLNGLSYQGMRIDHYALSKGDRIYLAPSVVLQYKPSYPPGRDKPLPLLYQLGAV